MPHYLVNLKASDGALLWGDGLRAKSRRDAIKKALGNYRQAYPHGTATFATVSSARPTKTYRLLQPFRSPISATVKDGNLIITANNEARAELAEAYRAGGYQKAESVVAEGLHEQFYFVAPEWIGALTDAPILTREGDYTVEDDGTFVLEDDAEVFWFPDYMITDPWEVLKNFGRVVFTGAPET